MVSSTILVTLAAFAAISPALAYTKYVLNDLYIVECSSILSSTREYIEDALLARELTDLFAREPRYLQLLPRVRRITSVPNLQFCRS